MTVAQQYVSRQSQGRGGPSGLADVLDVLLDKGLVIDAFVRVSLVGIELLTVDARVVVAGVDTYLHFAEAVNRLDLLQGNNSQTIGELVSGRSGGNSRPRRSETRKSDGNGQREIAPKDDEHSQHTEDRTREDDSRQDNGGHGNGKGLLSRIADRGQAF